MRTKYKNPGSALEDFLVWSAYSLLMSNQDLFSTDTVTSLHDISKFAASLTSPEAKHLPPRAPGPGFNDPLKTMAFSSETVQRFAELASSHPEIVAHLMLRLKKMPLNKYALLKYKTVRVRRNGRDVEQCQDDIGDKELADKYQIGQPCGYRGGNGAGAT